jgi:hypothetical protein
MKSVPNLIFYVPKIFRNFSQFLAIYFELFSFGVNLNSEITDERAPLVRHRAPRRARVAACRRRGLKPLSGQHVAHPDRPPRIAPAADRPTSPRLARAVVAPTTPRLTCAAVAPTASPTAPPSRPTPRRPDRHPGRLTARPTPSRRATVPVPVSHRFLDRLPCVGVVPPWASTCSVAAVRCAGRPCQVGHAHGPARVAVDRAPPWPWVAPALCDWAERGFSPLAPG